MIYEMRQYMIDRGRMADNHDRMKNHTPALLKKHGIRVVGRWEILAGPATPMFCYVMEFADMAERETCWASFYSDPEWPRVRAETNAGSEMVEEYSLFLMKPSGVFEIMTEPDKATGGLHQLILQKTSIGKAAAVNAFLRDCWLPNVRAAGAEVLAVSDMLVGAHLPSSAILLAWPTEKTWRTGWLEFSNCESLRSAYAAQRLEFGACLFGSADIYLMEPAPYALPTFGVRR